jgi:transcription termination factor NusB
MNTVAQYIFIHNYVSNNYDMDNFLIAKLSGQINSKDDLFQFVKDDYEFFNEMYQNAADDYEYFDTSIRNVLKTHSDLQSFIDNYNDEFVDLDWLLLSICRHNILNYDYDHICDLIETYNPFSKWDLETTVHQFHSFLSNNIDEV